MRTTKQLSITLPIEMAESVTEHVTSGAYASESEVIREGLRALFARESAIEAWLETQVAAAAEALAADQTRAVTADEVRAVLRTNAARRVAGREGTTGFNSRLRRSNT